MVQKNKIKNIKYLRKVVIKSIQNHLNYILPNCKVKIFKDKELDGSFDIYIKKKDDLLGISKFVCTVNLYGNCSIRIKNYRFRELAERISDYLNIPTIYDEKDERNLKERYW